MVMAYLIWQVTFGNGVRIGIVKTKYSVICGADLGTTVWAACVQLAAAASIQAGTYLNSTVFDVFQD